MSNLANSFVKDAWGDLMFRCPKKGENFNSGFTADHNSYVQIGLKSVRLRCHLCGGLHDFMFAEAQIRPRSVNIRFG